MPDLSIEVDDVDAALEGIKNAGFPIEYGPVDEPWGVRRFFVRDPLGKLVNILTHESYLIYKLKEIRNWEGICKILENYRIRTTSLLNKKISEYKGDDLIE